MTELNLSHVALLETLKKFTQEAICDLVLPVRVQKGDTEPQYRAADVYLAWLPDASAATKKAPYVLHSVLTGKDEQPSGQKTQSTCLVRTVFCVYSEDGQEGGMMLLNLIERLRIALLRNRIIGNRFKLDMAGGLEFLPYPNDTAPYYLGEMVTHWELPNIEQEVRQWL